MVDDILNSSNTSTPSPQEDKKTILLIEDDPFIAGIYKEKLTIEGFNVLHAEDGLQGLNLALTQKVDLMLLDILIPKLSGVDLLARLRQDEKGKSVPVIALTNLSGKNDEETVMSYGAKDYLVKSDYTPGQVVEIVRKYLP